MTDWLDELFKAEGLDGVTDGSAVDEGEAAKEELSEAERRELLVKMAAGSKRGLASLASELLVVHDERIATREQERLAAEAQKARETGGFDGLDPEDVKAMLRAEVKTQAVRDDEAYLRLYREGLVKQGFGESTIDERMAVAKAGIADLAEWTSRTDPLAYSDDWQARELAVTQQARAEAVARQHVLDHKTLDDFADEAREGIAQTMADVVAGAEA